MVHDIPKAVHFNAWRNGRKLAWNDPVGLKARWYAANHCKYELAIENMLALTSSQRESIMRFMFSHDWPGGLIVTMDDKTIDMAAARSRQLANV